MTTEQMIRQFSDEEIISFFRSDGKLNGKGALKAKALSAQYAEEQGIENTREVLELLQDRIVFEMAKRYFKDIVSVNRKK